MATDLLSVPFLAIFNLVGAALPFLVIGLVLYVLYRALSSVFTVLGRLSTLVMPYVNPDAVVAAPAVVPANGPVKAADFFAAGGKLVVRTGRKVSRA